MSMRQESEPLPPGAPMPRLVVFEWSTGAVREVGPAPTSTVIVLVRSDCPYCAEQLTRLQQHFDRFPAARFFFVTAESSPPAGYPDQWPRLASEPSVVWARASAAELFGAFPTRAVPSTFVFGKDGRLLRSFIGLTGVEAFVRELAPQSGEGMPDRLPH
jgi:thioredoxin-related protein